MQEGTQAKCLTLKLGEVCTAYRGRLEVRQDIIDIGDDLVLTEPQAVDLGLHRDIRIVIRTGLGRSRGSRSRAEHLGKLIDEAMGQALTVQVGRGHRPVDAIEGIIVPLERRELYFLQERPLGLYVEELIARGQAY